MIDIVQRIASRTHDAPLPTEYLLDEARSEIERLRTALTRISNGGTAVLISATLDECPINPEVLEQIIKDAVAALPNKKRRGLIAITKNFSSD